MDYTTTDLYQMLLAQKAILEERIAGTATHPEWQQHWHTEHQAVMRALWSLGDENTVTQVARKRYDPEWESAWAAEMRDAM